MLGIWCNNAWDLMHGKWIKSKIMNATCYSINNENSLFFFNFKGPLWSRPNLRILAGKLEWRGTGVPTRLPILSPYELRHWLGLWLGAILLVNTVGQQFKSCDNFLLVVKNLRQKSIFFSWNRFIRIVRKWSKM